jgi:hypothetical protein
MPTSTPNARNRTGLLKHTIFRPFQMLTMEPILLLITIYISIVGLQEWSRVQVLQVSLQSIDSFILRLCFQSEDLQHLDELVICRLVVSPPNSSRLSANSSVVHWAALASLASPWRVRNCSLRAVISAFICSLERCTNVIWFLALSGSPHSCLQRASFFPLSLQISL